MKIYEIKIILGFTRIICRQNTLRNEGLVYDDIIEGWGNKRGNKFEWQ